MTTANRTRPDAAEGARPEILYPYPYVPQLPPGLQSEQQQPVAYPPMNRPVAGRLPQAPQSPVPGQRPFPPMNRPAPARAAADYAPPERRTPRAAAPRMPKAQALEKVRGLKKVILGLTLSSFVAFGALAATHTKTTTTASATSSGSSTSASSAGASSSASSGYGFGNSGSATSQAPVTGSSTS